MSDDGETAIVVIAMMGNPFSPEYARARLRNGGRGDALRHCSMNVAIYGKRGTAWAFHEQRITSADRDRDGVAIGRSSMRWHGDDLVLDIDERTPPVSLSRRVRGRIVLHPEAHASRALGIDDEGQHMWWPVAPLARIDVELDEPRVRFRGHGYIDANAGDVPLESSFSTWSWSRARSEGRALLTYDVRCTSGATIDHAFEVSRAGAMVPVERTWRAPLPRTKFLLERHARVDHGGTPRVLRSLEDGPFYSRALVEARIADTPVVAVHETLDARRLQRAWVRFCTAYRMRFDQRLGGLWPVLPP